MPIYHLSRTLELLFPEIKGNGRGAGLPLSVRRKYRFSGSDRAKLVAQRWLAGVTGGSAGGWGGEVKRPHLARQVMRGRGRLLAWTGDNGLGG